MEITEQELNQYNEEAKITMSSNDYKSFVKERKLSFKSAEEVQGFLYKYNKEYFLEIHAEKGNYRVESILNSKKVDKYIDIKGNITTYGVNLVLDIFDNIKKPKFISKLSKIDVEFLLTELDIDSRKKLLYYLDKHSHLDLDVTKPSPKIKA